MAILVAANKARESKSLSSLDYINLHSAYIVSALAMCRYNSERICYSSE